MTTPAAENRGRRRHRGTGNLEIRAISEIHGSIARIKAAGFSAGCGLPPSRRGGTLARCRAESVRKVACFSLLNRSFAPRHWHFQLAVKIQDREFKDLARMDQPVEVNRFPNSPDRTDSVGDTCFSETPV